MLCSIDITIGLQADSYTVSEEDEVVTVCVEVISGENERDVIVSLSTLENGLAAGQLNVEFKHDTSCADDSVLLNCIMQLMMTMEC